MFSLQSDPQYLGILGTKLRAQRELMKLAYLKGHWGKNSSKHPLEYVVSFPKNCG